MKKLMVFLSVIVFMVTIFLSEASDATISEESKILSFELGECVYHFIIQPIQPPGPKFALSLVWKYGCHTYQGFSWMMNRVEFYREKIVDILSSPYEDRSIFMLRTGSNGSKVLILNGQSFYTMLSSRKMIADISVKSADNRLIAYVLGRDFFRGLLIFHDNIWQFYHYNALDLPAADKLAVENGYEIVITHNKRAGRDKAEISRFDSRQHYNNFYWLFDDRETYKR